MQLTSNTVFSATIDLPSSPAGLAPPTIRPSASQVQLMAQVVMALMRLIKAQAGPATPFASPGQPVPMAQAAPPSPFTGLQPLAGMPVSSPASSPATAPGPVTTGRPPGDTRTAEQIIDDPANATLKNLGHQKDIKRDALTARLGDLNDPDPARRADAAYNWAGTLNSVKQLKAWDGTDRGTIHTNGKLEGITHDGDARHGTEAGVLKDFAETGAFPTDGRLPTTTDTHVRKNGTNKNNLQWGMEQLGKFITGALSKVFSVLADVVSCTLGRIPGIGKFLAAPAEIVARGISGGMAVANVAIGGGDVKAAGREMGLQMLDTVVSSTVGIADPTGVAAGQAGQAARDAADPAGRSSPDALALSLG